MVSKAAEPDQAHAADRRVRARVLGDGLVRLEVVLSIEAVQILALAPTDQTRVVLDLCDRLCAMVTRLSGAATGPHPPPRGR